MKLPIRILATTLGLAASLSAARAAEEAKPAAPSQKKELRVIVGSEHNAPRPPGRVDRRVFVSHGEAGEKEIVTFLGVETGPVSPALTAQLGLPNDSGLVVNRVVPDSPAAGVLKEHDILLKLDDQILVDQRQLSVLIRNHKEGDEVTLTYLRGGKQATAKAKLVKREVPKLSAVFEQPLFGGGNVLGFSPGGATWTPGAAITIPGQPAGREEVDRVLSLMQRHTGEPVRIQIDRQDGPGVRAMSINTGNSNLVYSDDDGSLELTMKDGRKSLVAKDAKGAQLFAGPVTTPEERKALPGKVRERLEKLEGMQDITFRTDGDFKGAETKIMRPLGRGISLPHPPPAPPRPPQFY